MRNAQSSTRRGCRIAAWALLALAMRAGHASAGDNCSSPTSISGTGVFPFNLVGTTFSPEGQDQCTQPGQVSFENDVWYCWTATCNGLVDISTCGQTNVDTKIALYNNGCTCPTPPPSFGPFCCNDDVGVAGCQLQSRFTCEVQCGHQYLIRLGTKPGTPPGSGTFTIACNGSPCTPVCDTCCGKRPNFITNAGFTNSVAAVTQESGINTRVLDFINIGAPQAATGSMINWNAPFYTPTAVQNWTQANLGTVFGVTIDNLGNVYVAHSSVYIGYSSGGGGGGFGGDAIGTIAGGAAGAIYKINTNTGVPSVFAVLPNAAIIGCTGTECWPGLGNLCYSCAHSNFYVSNHEDGRIYRLDTSGAVLSTWKHSTGTLMVGNGLDPFDTNGFSKLNPHPTTQRAQRVWAVRVSQGRLFYSTWREDSGRQDPNHNNEIWSINLQPSGEFIAGSEILELNMPPIGGTTGTYSNPVSDISFKPNSCCMLLAERSMNDDTTSGAHTSRLLEYCRSGTSWAPSGNTFNVGASLLDSCAGGCDYDFNTGAGINVNVWSTGDAIKLGDPPPTDIAIYGIGGMTFSGTNPYANGLMVDSNQNTSVGDKFQQGDVEITCPNLVPPICEPLPDGTGCNNAQCISPVQQNCVARCILISPGQAPRVTRCDCLTPGTCHAVMNPGASVPECVGGCPTGYTCIQRVNATPEGIEYCCECVQDPPACEPTPNGQACKPFACPFINESCKPRCVRYGPTGPVITECDCRGPNECYVQFDAATQPHCAGSCPAGQTCVQNVIQNADGTITICCDCRPVLCQCPGDVNGDGILNGLDIAGFVRCFLGTSLPTDHCECADIDGNGVYNNLDITAIIQRILSKAVCNDPPTPCCPKANLSINIATGVFDGGGLIPVNSNDDTWNIVAESPNTYGSLPRPATVITPVSAWQTIPGTQWISNNINAANGTYVYEFCFCLDSRFHNPLLNMQIMTDDAGQVFLNGNLLGNTGPFSGPPANISTSNPAFFHSGNNCIRVVVQNQGGPPTGVDLAGTVTALDGKCCCPPRDLNHNVDSGVYDNGGGLIPGGLDDDTWTVTVDASGGSTPRPATVLTNIHPLWLTIPGTRWISANQNGPNGLYIYKHCFCLAPGFQNPVLDLYLRADDYAEVWLNGIQVGATPNGWAFNTPQPTHVFVNNPALFKPCQNCIEIKVTNSGGAPTGVNIAGNITAINGRCCDDPQYSCCLSTGLCVDLAPGNQVCPDGTAAFIGPCGTNVPCCLPNGSCQSVEPHCCVAQGGTVLPAGTVCGGAPQACCIQLAAGPVVCLNIDPACCTNVQHGTPKGAGTSCQGDTDGDGVDQACEEPPTCHVNAATGRCAQTACPVPGEECLTTCALVDTATHVVIQAYTCDCRTVQDCHMEFSPAPVTPICSGRNCPPGTTCQQTITDLGNGTSKVCCECVQNPPPVCQPDPLVLGCSQTQCATPTDQCLPVCVKVSGGHVVAVNQCDCMPTTQCHVVWDANFGNAHCQGVCPNGQTCNSVLTVNPDGTENLCCQCQSSGTFCPIDNTDYGSTLCANLQSSQCQGPIPTTNACRPQVVIINSAGGIDVQSCNCFNPNDCGAVSVQMISPGNYILTCQGPCNAMPGWNCHLHVNGQPYPQSQIPVPGGLPPGSVVTCRCAP